MKKQYIIFLLVSFCKLTSHAQGTAKNLFIDKGKIEYEVTQNFHKTASEWGFPDNLKEQVSKFVIDYYSLTFGNGKSLYKYERANSQNKVPPFMNMGKDDDKWYSNINTGQIETSRNVFGEIYNLKDSLLKIKWKIINENRVIAGYNCRKAVGKVFDSVYVYAFYTDEIMFSGGPMGISGLPGTILGVTIPRLYTSFIATKVEPYNINLSVIDNPPAMKGKKKSFKEMKDFISSRTEDWGKFAQSFIWNVIL